MTRLPIENLLLIRCDLLACKPKDEDANKNQQSIDGPETPIRWPGVTDGLYTESGFYPRPKREEGNSNNKRRGQANQDYCQNPQQESTAFFHGG